MREIYFKSSKAVLKIIISHGDYNLIKEDKFLYSYIPSLEIYEKEKNKRFSAEIIIKEANQNSLKFDFPNIEYNYIEFNTKDVISLIEYVLERCRQEKGIICIHGAAAILKNNLIISWGPATGMGKTTLALELAKHGKFYSDEKVLIDLDKKLGVGRIKNQYISNDYWRNKYESNNLYKEIITSKKINYKIGLLVHPIICNSNEFIIDVWNKEKFLWHLYEESCRKIRGTSRVFFDNTYPAPSLDTLELSKQRLELLKLFVNDIKCIYYKGNINDIVFKINNYIQ